jgi:acyl-coenzyme A synthetase/AMP-(fatty) acid ligase
MIEHRSLVNLCFWHNRYYHVSEYDNATQYAGIGFDASVWEIFPYLIKGASLHIISDAIKLDIEKLDRYYKKNHITISFLPTQMCEQFMALENRSLRKLLTGGDKLRIFKERDYDLYNNYGPTENTVVNTSYIVKTYDENIPIGKPVANNRIYILDSHNLHVQTIGTAGELCIAGDGLARGYLNNPELTVDKFPDNIPEGAGGLAPLAALDVGSGRFYCTGDLARWLPDGNIQFLGRIDHQVKIRGFRIELGEVENQLLKHKKIKEAAVIDREDESKEKYLCAYIVPDGGAPVVVAAELREFLTRTLPPYMIPSFFVPTAQIPLTPNGKIDRNSLPPPAGEIDTGTAYAAARSKEEMLIRDIWQEVLQLHRVGIHDNFFELGGNSLKVIAVGRKLKQAFNRDIPVVILFRYPRISALAEYLTREQGDKEEKPKPRLKERARGKNKQKILKARRRR